MDVRVKHSPKFAVANFLLKEEMLYGELTTGAQYNRNSGMHDW